MSAARKNYIGSEGFIWYLGVVEDRFDPEKLGRVRVRCFGWHNKDKEQIPTDDLFWALPVFPPNLSWATHTPKEGDWVFGFFIDAMNAQNPVIVGVLPGKPVEKANSDEGFNDPNGVYPKRINEATTSRLARGRTDGTVIQTRNRSLVTNIRTCAGVVWDEPRAPYSAEYPFNNAHETESGHAFELDDTQGRERINLAHKNGSFIEMDYYGNKVQKVVNNEYSLIMGSDFIYVKGNCNVTVGGNCNLKVFGKLNVEAAEINMAATGDIKMRAGGRMKIQTGNSFDAKVGGVARIGSGGKLNLKGKSATLQGRRVNLKGLIKNKVKCPRKICKIRSASPNASSPTNSGLSLPFGSVTGSVFPIALSINIGGFNWDLNSQGITDALRRSFI